MVQIQEFSVRIEGGLNLIEFIVTKRANKPFPGTGLFEFVDDIVSGERGGVISGEIKGGGEVFPIDDVALIQLDGDLQFALGFGEGAFLQIEATESAMELRVAGSQGDGQLQGFDGVVELILADLNVGTEAEIVERGGLPVLADLSETASASSNCLLATRRCTKRVRTSASWGAAAR